MIISSLQLKGQRSKSYDLLLSFYSFEVYHYTFLCEKHSYRFATLCPPAKKKTKHATKSNEPRGVPVEQTLANAAVAPSASCSSLDHLCPWLPVSPISSSSNRALPSFPAFIPSFRHLRPRSFPLNSSWLASGSPRLSKAVQQQQQQRQAHKFCCKSGGPAAIDPQQVRQAADRVTGGMTP